MQGMRDLGLEGLGAHLSLLGRQVASALDSVLPAEVRTIQPARGAARRWPPGRRVAHAAGAVRCDPSIAAARATSALVLTRHACACVPFACSLPPAQLNPFGYDEDELEEEAARAQAK